MLLETERLILRLPTLNDAPAMVELLKEKQIALNTLPIPYPYHLEDAKNFIQFCEQSDENQINLAIERRSDGVFLGMCGMSVEAHYKRGIIGYWIGKPFWNQGYTSEAARRVVKYGFEERGLEKIMADCFAYNIGSARVMEKSGMTREGFLRGHYYHHLHEKMIDVYSYGILRTDYFGTS